MAHSSVVHLPPRHDHLPPGLTSRGWEMLTRTRNAMVRDQSRYTMVEKVHLLWDVGDAWSDHGWFTAAEKAEA